MGTLLLVGLGGFVGTLLRYGVGGWLSRTRGAAHFPYATLVINVTGCVAIGLIATLAEARSALSPSTRAFLFIGLLGGYTTFSTFGYETFQLLRDGRLPAALLSAGLQVILGIGGVWIGAVVARLLSR